MWRSTGKMPKWKEKEVWRKENTLKNQWERKKERKNKYIKHERKCIIKEGRKRRERKEWKKDWRKNRKNRRKKRKETKIGIISFFLHFLLCNFFFSSFIPSFFSFLFFLSFFLFISQLFYLLFFFHSILFRLNKTIKEEEKGWWKVGKKEKTRNQ